MPNLVRLTALLSWIFLVSILGHAQPFVDGPGYAVTSASEDAGVLTINLAVNTASTSTPYGTDLSALVVTVTKTDSDSVRV
ncbi:hypothetical protein JG688_00018423, partial [Phytophthora aleatoria]